MRRRTVVPLLLCAALAPPSAAHAADATAPTVTVLRPSGRWTLAQYATFSYRGSDASGVASYDVRYRQASLSTPYGPYRVREGWTGTTATSVSAPIVQGYENCFSVRARDHAGNVSAWTPDRCVSRPLDDRWVAASPSWRRVEASGYYRDTYTVTTAAGASMTRQDVSTRRLALVATVCAACGSVEVYQYGTLVGAVSLARPETRHRVVLPLPALAALRNGPVSIRVTSRDKLVRIDGLASSRV